MDKVFSIIGDSNILRNMNSMSCRDRPKMLAAQVLPCTKVSLFAESLRGLRGESNVCIVSCVTNFMTSSSEGSSTLGLRLEPILLNFFSQIKAACVESPGRAYLVCPPMYRRSPLWYRDGLPEVLTRFSAELMKDRPPNLLAMPSFPTPSFEDDGVHLTAYSGLEFVLHLFDTAESILDTLDIDPGVKVDQNRESSRVLEDRMVALEQDHRRLCSVVDMKIAIDAELADIQINERHQNCFVIFGLPPIPSEIVGKPWQERAKKDTQAVVKEFMGSECSIVYIQNITSRAPDSEVRYKVTLTTVEESSRIRDAFRKFFTGGDKRPDSLKPISIRNLLTQESRVRLSILHLYARRYSDSNPGSKTHVAGYDNRPLLKLTPPPDAEDTRVQVYTFIDAVQKLPGSFSKEELKPVLDQVRYQTRFSGKLRSLFVVISDDMISKGPKVTKPKAVPSSSAPSTAESGESSMETDDTSRKRSAPAASEKKGRGKNKNPKV